LKATFTTLAALALSTGIASANPGHDQHAATLGVDPAVFTEAELALLGDAVSEGDMVMVAFLKSKAGAGMVGSDTVGHAQHAAIVGVDPAAFTEAEVTELGNAIREGDVTRVAYLKSKGDRPVVFSFGETVNPGKQMLADIAGVNVNDYTLSQLIEMTNSSQD
jgi:hypothetical protein